MKILHQENLTIKIKTGWKKNYPTVGNTSICRIIASITFDVNDKSIVWMSIKSLVVDEYNSPSTTA